MRSVIVRRRICPKCRAWKKQVKNGKNPSGSRRIKCGSCGKTYTSEVRSNEYPFCYAVAAMWFAHAFTYRQIAEMLDVTPQTVVNWVKKYQSGFYLSAGEFHDLVRLVPDVFRQSLSDHDWRPNPDKKYHFPLLQELHPFENRQTQAPKNLRKLSTYIKLT